LKEFGKRLATFTQVPRAGFNGPVPKGRYADESGRVEKIAAMHDNIDINLIRPSEDETLLDGSDDLFDCTESPFRNPTNRPWIEAILREQQARGSKAILSGAFGNFTFSWNGSESLPDRLRRRELWPVLKETLALSRAQQRPWWRVFGAQALLPLMPLARWHLSRQSLHDLLRRTPLWHGHSAIHPEFARSASVRQRGMALGHDFRYTVPLDSRRARWFMLMAPDFSADTRAGWKARYGVEQRLPATDRRILEYCLSLPEEQFLHQGVSRRLVKRAFGNRLPAEVLYSRERGLQSPDWFEHLTRQKQQLCREVQLLKNHPSARRYLDVERLEQLINNWPSQGWDKSNLYQSMLTRGIMTGRFVRWFEGDNHC
jgi:asparagine synthase (glutamine-hydrolysing)